MDTKDTVETTVPSAAPAKAVPVPKPPLLKEHGLEPATVHPVHEAENLSTVPLSGTGLPLGCFCQGIQFNYT